MDDKRDASAGGTAGDSSPGAQSPADETFAWTAPDGGADPAASSGDPRATAERMLAQLQSMIDNVATQAAPVVRQIGVKAAELAAVAADRAGPIAHRAADATADASEKLAEKSRTWAAELRTKMESANGSGDANGGTSTAVLDSAVDPIEPTHHDEPAEGPRE
jgi:hypothetical protein